MPDNQRSDLRYYCRALVRRKRTVVVVTTLLTAAALGLSLLQEPVYRASAQLLIETGQSRSLFEPGSGSSRDFNRALQNQIGVLKSEPIRVAVKREIPEAPPITVAVLGQTDIVIVHAESTNPGLAATTANAYARAYIDHRQRQAVENQLAASREIQKKIDDLDGQIAAVESQINGAEEGANGPSSSLGARRDSLIAQQALFRQRLAELQVDAGLEEPPAQLVNRAAVPTMPISPKPVQTTILALIGGLAFGSALALLRERLDDTIKTKDEAEQTTPGLAVLATVPAVPGWKKRGRAHMVSVTDPGAPAAEAYRALRTAIEFMSLNRPLGAVQVTSPGAGEGKSTTVANLAVTIGRTGKKVVVVCCDLRRPRIHEFFGLEARPGFTSVLLGKTTLGDALQVVEFASNVTVLPAGPAPPNPSELLSSTAAAGIIEELKGNWDVVLVDSPPVLPVTDAAIISSLVDATVMVAAAGETTRCQLREAVNVLQQLDAALVGLVLNGTTRGAGYGASYACSSSAGWSRTNGSAGADRGPASVGRSVAPGEPLSDRGEIG